jgi:hypothetical protein
MLGHVLLPGGILKFLLKRNRVGFPLGETFAILFWQSPLPSGSRENRYLPQSVRYAANKG